MSDELRNRRVAFLTANEGVEQVELTSPWEAVERAGGEPRLVAPESGRVQAFHHLDRADTFEVDLTTAEAGLGDLDAIVLPGGVANADKLRTDGPAVELVRLAFETGRPVAVICHGAWTIVEAGVLRGRTLTSYPSLRTDITNAGGTWVDEEVVVCENGPNALVSSRHPGDLPAFEARLVEVFAAAGVRSR
jgi:protease I